jgi:uncharacterized damage-inducible protein DinB
MRLELVDQNQLLLRQARELLEGLADEEYSSPAGGRAGIGPHLRHCIDFYTCFLRDWAGARVDYDRRERNPRIEADRHTALAEIARLSEALEAISDADPGRALAVRVDVSPREARDEAWHPTSIGRELRFLVSHTVHHYALIAQILRGRGVEPGREFGVAPSTLAYWRAESEAGTEKSGSSAG